MEKACRQCNVTKPLTEFYAHKQMADGYLNKCKECVKSRVRKHRADNLESIQAYDRARGMLPHRVAARAEYQQTEQGKVAMGRANRAYQERNPDRRAAHCALSNAVRDGKIWKSPCCMAPGCFSTRRLHGHHTHYDNPLSVVWLCDKCHRQLHKEFDQRGYAA